MQTPIITNESLSQMTLMQLTSYVLKLLSEALPHVENVETAEANATASASAAASSASAAASSASAAAESFAQVEPAVNDGIASINAAVNSGRTIIANTITTVLNTEV